MSGAVAVKLPKGSWGVRLEEHSTYTRPKPPKSTQLCGDILPEEIYVECPMVRTLFVAPDGTLVGSRLDALKTTKGVALQVLELVKKEGYMDSHVVKLRESYAHEEKQHEESPV